MRVNRNKTNLKKNEEGDNKDDLKNTININNNNNNKIIDNKNEKNIDLGSPIPSFPYQKKQPNQALIKNKENKENKNKLYEMIEVEYENIIYRLFIYINDDDNLVIELIPKEGYLPYSYKNIFEEETFYNINKIFKELKTIDKIGQKIVNLYRKNKVVLSKDQKEELFYLILKITIIDEDTDIFIPLNKNDNIQICTINYLLKEADRLKNDFSEYKNETEDIIKQKVEEINELKKTNSLYLKIINKIKEEYERKNKKKRRVNESDDDEYDENEDNNNKIINKDKNKVNNINNDEDEVLNKVNKIIIDENKEYKIIKSKIASMESEINRLTKNHRCDINSKYIVLNLSVNQCKPFVLINFELENTGIYPLTNKLDDIFCNIEGINEACITFYDDNEKYIFLHEPLQTNQKIIVRKKLLLNNPIANRKYDFFLNIYSLKHGRISEQPIKFQICVRENDEQDNFINFLHDKKWGFDYKNKLKNNNQKIIFQYVQTIKKKNDNNISLVDKNGTNDLDYEIKEGDIKIRKFVYDEKAGMAYEKEKNGDNKEIKLDKLFDNLEMNIMINKDEVNKIAKRILNKYKNSKKLNRNKIEDVICSCVGDFKKISRLIEDMI
jgi:hypothetical protein